jgi:hypothetical protein
MLQPLDLANGNHIVMVDKNGIKIANSDINEKSSLSNQTMQQSSFTILQSLKNDINGNTDTVYEPLEGSKVTVSFKVIKAIQINWVILLIKPFDRTFFFFRGRMHLYFVVLVLMLSCRSGICLWISASSIKMIAAYHTLSFNKTKNGLYNTPVILNFDDARLVRATY